MSLKGGFKTKGSQVVNGEDIFFVENSIIKSVWGITPGGKDEKVLSNSNHSLFMESFIKTFWDPNKGVTPFHDNSRITVLDLHKYVMKNILFNRIFFLFFFCFFFFLVKN